MIYTRLCDLLNIKYPIIQGGMAYVSHAGLVAAVSNAGGLGLLGSSTMMPEELRKEIKETRKFTSKPFGVNIALISPGAEAKVDICISEKVEVVFTAAGSPKIYTQKLRDAGVKVAHVVPSAKLAEKAVAAGVEMIVCEGFEAGGHDGPEELTIMTLVPLVKRAIGDIPLIAAGGITTGEQLAAVIALGADGVQIGTLFVATKECNAHPLFKQKIVEAGETGTIFTARKYHPQRILRNPFAERLATLESAGASGEDVRNAYGPNRGRKGAIDGNWDEGYFNCGQGASLITKIKSVADVITDLIDGYKAAVERLLASLKLRRSGNGLNF